MKMRLLIVGLLTTAISSLMIALSPQPAVGREIKSAGAAQLQSSPEMMECSLERSRALWQFPNPARLGDVPCQLLNSIGGPEDGEALIYTPVQMESVEHSLGVGLTRETNQAITQPLDSFAPIPTRRGQWVDLTNASSRGSLQWLRDNL